jgi:hypothetical protein
MPDCTTRFNDVIVGALAGAVVDDCAVIETPAGAPAASAMDGTCVPAVGKLSVPPLVGIDCVAGADDAVACGIGV